MDISRQDELQLKSIIYSSLQGARNSPQSGLEKDSLAETHSRLLQIVKGDLNWQIHVGSDGLKLDHKMVIEKKLLGDLSKEYPKEPFTIYFRRIQRDENKPRNKENKFQPTAVPPSPSGPLGLKIRQKPIKGVKNIILIASGKGGVGKSTVSTNLAVAMANQGKRVGLLDADIYGPSSPTMLGVKGPMLVGENGKLDPLVAHNVKIVSFGFLSDKFHPVVWRGPMISKAINQFCFDVNWNELDLLIIDLPPGTGDIQLSLMESVSIQGALIVSTPQDVALLDAHKALSMFQELQVPVFGIIENMSYYFCPQCGHKDQIFGDQGARDFSQQRKISLFGTIPLHSSIRMASDTGQPISLQKSRPQAKLFGDLAQKVFLSLECKSNHQ